MVYAVEVIAAGRKPVNAADSTPLHITNSMFIEEL
jgi:hypothetical protein